MRFFPVIAHPNLLVSWAAFKGTSSCSEKEPLEAKLKTWLWWMVESGFFNQKHCAAAHAYFCDCKYQRGATGSFDVCSEWFFGRSIKFPTRVSLCYRFFLKKSFCQPCSAASVDAQHSAVTCVYHIAVLHGLCSVDHAHIMHGSSCVLSYSTFDFFSHKHTYLYYTEYARSAVVWSSQSRCA